MATYVSRIPHSGFLAGLLAAAVVFGAWQAVTAVAATVTNTTVLSACYANMAPYLPKGSLRLVTKATDCKSYQTFVSWNVQGIQGDPGSQGAWRTKTRS